MLRKPTPATIQNIVQGQRNRPIVDHNASFHTVPRPAVLRSTRGIVYKHIDRRPRDGHIVDVIVAIER